MRKSFLWFGIIGLALVALAGCEQPVGSGDGSAGDGTGGGGPQLSAADLTDEGIAALEDGELTLARDKFTQALLVDETYGLAALGYVVLEAMLIATDADTVDFATGNLGFVDYPDAPEDILDNPFFDLTTGFDGVSEFEYFFPDVAGQSDDDVNGYIDPDEKFSAFLEFYFLNNAGVEEAIDFLVGIFGGRVDVLVPALANIDDDDFLTFSWPMFFSTQADAEDFSDGDGWPLQVTDVDDVTTLYPLVIGKGEAELIVAGIVGTRAFMNVAAAYDVSLDSAESASFSTWLVGLASGDSSNEPANPFDGTFGGLAADAVALYAQAEDDLVTAAELVASGLGRITARDGAIAFSLGPASAILGAIDPTAWSNVRTGMGVYRIFADEIATSVDAGVASQFANEFNFPQDQAELDALEASWPTADFVEVNIAAFFGTPAGLYAYFVETDVDYEPVFYDWNSVTEQFDVVSNYVGNDPTDDTSAAGLYYVKIQGATLNGLIEYTVDDPTTLDDIVVSDCCSGLGTADDGLWAYEDNVVSNGSWDVGEYADWVNFNGGLFAIGNMKAPGYGGDAEAYLINGPTGAQLNAKTETGTDGASLLAYMQNQGQLPNVNATSAVFDDTTGELYFASQGTRYFYWNASKPAGTVDADGGLTATDSWFTFLVNSWEGENVSN